MNLDRPLNVSLAPGGLGDRTVAKMRRAPATPQPDVDVAAPPAVEPPQAGTSAAPRPLPKPIDGRLFALDLAELMTGRRPEQVVPPASDEEPEPECVDLRALRSAVCAAMGVALGELVGSSRHHDVVAARELFAWAGHELCRASFPEIGRAIGRRNHSTVHCAAQRFGRRPDREELIGRVWASLPPNLVVRAADGVAGRTRGRSARHGRGD